MEVTPSILTQDTRDLWRQIKRLLPYFSHFHIDIADGQFVTGKTISIQDFGASLEEQKIIFNDHQLVLDFHLMAVDYRKNLEEISKIQNESRLVDTVLIHESLNPDIHLLYREYRLKLGLVLNPEDSISDFLKKYDLNSVSSIQLMAVHPGAQEQPFLPEMLRKIEQLRNADYRHKIYLDGGINEKTFPLIFDKKFRPDVITPGSYFSKSTFLRGKIKTLQKYLRAEAAQKA